MAGTDSTKGLELKPGPAVILCEPQLGENIGTAARAMANFGLWDLRLVNPRDGWPSEKARSAAAKANHVIDRVQVFDSVEDAIADLTRCYATTARSRDMYKPVIGPDVAADEMVAPIKNGEHVGILFGRERWGLNNDEVALCDKIVTLPVEPAFASLNIAQAVLVLAYEWRRAYNGAGDLPFDGPTEEPATREDLVGLMLHLEEALDRVNFFKTPGKRPSMVANMRAMFARAQMNVQEVRTFRGVVAALDRRHERPNPLRDQSKYKQKKDAE